MQLFELAVIFILIICQFVVFQRNRTLIKRVTTMYPPKGALRVVKEYIDEGELIESDTSEEVYKLADPKILARIFASVPFVVHSMPEHLWKLSVNNNPKTGLNSYSLHYKGNTSDYVIDTEPWVKEDLSFDYIDNGTVRVFRPAEFTDTELISWLKYEPLSLREGDEEVAPISKARGVTSELTYDAISSNVANDDFDEVVYDTNEYLRNNHGVAADFNILKDISERHAEAMDEEIQAQISTPLYLGLLGTFAGAILGLIALVNPLNYSASAGASFNNADVSHFLGGVLIAMGGSLFGLAFTLIGNHLLKKARAVRDRHKNLYYNFLQKALLPKLNSDMQSSMSNLKAVLDTFNQDFFSKIQQDFFSKISEFTPLISSITANISVQKNFLDKLQTIGYTQLANSTIKIFDRVEESAATFDKFLGYQQILNRTLLNSTDVVQTIDSLLTRLSSLEKGLLDVPKYLQEHDANIRGQVAFFAQHNHLLADLGGRIRENIDGDAEKMREILRQRMAALDQQAQTAHEEWYQHFQRLNNDNVYERIVEYLDPFKDIAAQQRELNVLQEKQSSLSARALEKLEQRLVADSSIQERLIQQAERTNKVLESTNEMLREINGRSWVERMFGRKEKSTGNGQRSTIKPVKTENQPATQLVEIEKQDSQSE